MLTFTSLVDDARVLLARFVVLHQRFQLARRADHLYGVRIEEIEEATFLGKQSAEHV